MTDAAVRYQAHVDRELARIRDRLDQDHTDTLARILHTDDMLADIVRLSIGAVILDLRETLDRHPSSFLPSLTAWAQIAEPGTVR